MKRLQKYFIAACVIAATSAMAADPITITASKKTADSRQKTSSNGPRHSVSHGQKDVFYRFEIATMRPGIEPSIIVKWVVLIEDMHGRVHVGTSGTQEASLIINKPVVIETDDFSLESREVRKRGVVREDEASVLGYGVRICDTQGHIIAEKTEPSRAERKIVEAFSGKMRGDE